MTAAPVGLLVAVALAAVLLAALLSAGETAVRRLGRTALAELALSEDPAARRARRVMEEPHAAASGAGLVRVVCESVAAVCITVALAATDLGWWPTVLLSATVVAAVALLAVRRLPRSVARRHSVPTLLATARLLALAATATGPVRRTDPAYAHLHDLTDEEIRDMVDRVSGSEHMEHEEREMFRSVLELGETITRAVMVPRTEMITLTSGTPLRKAMSLFLRSGYSRVPVIGESVDDLLGVLYLKDVVRRWTTVEGSQHEPVDGLLRAPVFVPESKPVDDLLHEMQRGAFHMAMVVDEFGGIAGLVTIEDALEEIVGELTDEHDLSGPEVEELDNGTFRIPARLPLDELGELFELQIEDDDVDTAGGLLAKSLGKVPLAGSSAEVTGLLLAAERVEGRRKRVATLVVRRAGDRPEEPAAGGATAAQAVPR